MLLPTELEGRTHLINLIRLLLSDYFYQINKKFWPHRGSNSQPSRFSTMLLPTELEGSTHVITVIRLLLSDYYYPGSDWNPDPKIRPVVHEKQLSGSQIRISIRITPNFELRLPMIITSLITKFRQNPTSSLWEILLTNKQTNRHTKVIAISRFSRDKNSDRFRHVSGEAEKRNTLGARPLRVKQLLICNCSMFPCCRCDKLLSSKTCFKWSQAKDAQFWSD